MTMLFVVGLANIEIGITACVEFVAIDQMVRYRAADHAGRNQAQRAGSNANLGGIGDSEPLSENWGPGDRRA